MMGGEVAAVGLSLPTLSSESPALRRGDEDKKSRSFERFAPPGPEPPVICFFLLKCGSGTAGASSLSPRFLNGEQRFGSALRGFDPEEEHPIASRAGKRG